MFLHEEIPNAIGNKATRWAREEFRDHLLTTLGQNSPCPDDQLLLEDETNGKVWLRQELNDIIAQSVQLLRDAGLINSEAWDEAQICPDGMLHQAASRLRCAHVQARCYEPTAPEQPRPCPAQEKGKKGCACDTLACASTCCFATPRAPEARLVVYKGHNQLDDSPNKASDPLPKMIGRMTAVELSPAFRATTRIEIVLRFGASVLRIRCDKWSAKSV